MVWAAVLLDMDGTLVGSDAAVDRAWEQWAVEHGVEAGRVHAVAHGNPAATVVRLLLPDLSDEQVLRSAQRQHELQYDDLSDVVALPGALELLALLDERRLPWAVVTSADRRLAAARLGACAIHPPLLVTVEDVRRGKPDPESYLLAAERLGVRPRGCLVVEDSDPGLEAGRAAGMRTAALRGLVGDLRIAGLPELTQLLRADG